MSSLLSTQPEVPVSAEAADLADQESLSAASRKKISRSTAKFARENPRRSWFAVISSLLLLLAALAGTLPFWAVPFRVVSSVLAALMLVRVFVIYHDHQHRAILSKSRLADRIMKVVGVMVLAPSSVWKHSHDAHHAHNSKLHGNDLGSYPTMTEARYRASSLSERIRYRVSRHPLTVLGGYLTSFLYAMCLGPFFDNPRKHLDGLISVVVHLAFITLMVLTVGWLGAFLTIFLPFIIASCLGSYLFYAQHNFPGVKLEDEDGWTYEGAALESSSFMRMPKVLHWFTGNIGYHHIHHLNARIPFYRLPEAYAAIPELQQAKTTSLSPVDIVRCFRLKVWSVEENRLVGYGKR